MSIFFGTEIWSVLLMLFVQDLPFLITRLIVLAKYPIAKSTNLYYLTIKNCVLCILEVYRLVILFMKERKHIKRIEIRKKIEDVLTNIDSKNKIAEIEKQEIPDGIVIDEKAETVKSISTWNLIFIKPNNNGDDDDDANQRESQDNKVDSDKP